MFLRVLMSVDMSRHTIYRGISMGSKNRKGMGMSWSRESMMIFPGMPNV